MFHVEHSKFGCFGGVPSEVKTRRFWHFHGHCVLGHELSEEGMPRGSHYCVRLFFSRWTNRTERSQAVIPGIRDA